MTPSTGDRAGDASAANGRLTVLFIVDELKAKGLPQRSRALIEALSQRADLVLVAQCYLKPSHRARRLAWRHDLYGFGAANYDTDVAAFAADLRDRHRPACAVLYGWENAQLVVELERLDVPVVSYTETASDAPNAESQLNRTLRHATEVLFSNPSIPSALTQARWGLESRAYQTIDETPGMLVPRPAASGGRVLPFLFQQREPSADHIEVDRTSIALEQACRRAVARCARRLKNADRDKTLIEAEGGLDLDLAAPPGDARQNAVKAYLKASDLAVPRGRVAAGRLLRRPIAGFNPLIYATDRPAFNEAEGEDPLAHYLRAGRPKGRWTHDVLRHDETIAAQPPIAAAIHVHLHYPELLTDLLERIGTNSVAPDLIITTTSQESREVIAACLREAGVTAAMLRVVENRGRDLWPFLSLLQEGAFDDYAIVGHFHSKRSPHFDAGQVWRDFLWTHLVGGAAPMLGRILACFAETPRLGLVFAEEPHLEGWEQNLERASALASRAGLPLPLPLHFEYPMGTMFWVRTAALAPLRKLGLTADDVPPEPLAIDGTILHALERLIPFFVAAAGFDYATTHVPGSTR